MTRMQRGDVAIGGGLGYDEVITKVAEWEQYLQAYDDAHLDNPILIDNPMLVSGATFSPSGHLYLSCADPTQNSDYDPHGIVWLPKAHAGAQLAVLIARVGDTLELWEYDSTLNDPVTVHTGLDVDPGWNRKTYTHLDCLSDGRTIYYTTQGKTIFRYHLDDGQLTPFTQLGPEAHHIYADLKIVQKTGRVLVAMTSTGHGPRNAVCFDSNGTSLWHDEINPPGAYNIWKRLIADGSLVNDVAQGVPEGKFEVSLAPGVAGVGNNAEVFSLACWLQGTFGAHITVLG